MSDGDAPLRSVGAWGPPAAADGHSDLVGFVLVTGCRIGAAADVTWDVLDLDAGTVGIVGWGLPLAEDFPTAPPCSGCPGAVLVEAHDEWQVSDRRSLSEGSMALLASGPTPPRRWRSRP